MEQYGESSGGRGDTCMFVVCVAACSVDTCKADPSTAAANAFTLADYYDIRVSRGQAASGSAEGQAASGSAGRQSASGRSYEPFKREWEMRD